jgi:hypothetical protein
MENVAAHVAEGADGVGKEDSAVLNVAALFFTEAFLEGWCICGGVACAVPGIARPDQRNRKGGRPLDIFRTAENVPAVIAGVTAAASM